MSKVYVIYTWQGDNWSVKKCFSSYSALKLFTQITNYGVSGARSGNRETIEIDGEYFLYNISCYDLLDVSDVEKALNDKC